MVGDRSYPQCDWALKGVNENQLAAYSQRHAKACLFVSESSLHRSFIFGVGWGGYNVGMGHVDLYLFSLASN